MFGNLGTGAKKKGKGREVNNRGLSTLRRKQNGKKTSGCKQKKEWGVVKIQTNKTSSEGYRTRFHVSGGWGGGGGDVGGGGVGGDGYSTNSKKGNFAK